MHEDLLKPFTWLEVDYALIQIDIFKASEPNGYGACFYQSHRSIVRDDVSMVVLNFLNEGVGLIEVNQTYIVLVFKKKNPWKMTEYRFISLCNVIYEIIT